VTKLNSRKYIAADPSKCTGCGLCEYVCALEKSEGTWNLLMSRIRVVRMHPLLNVAIACKFCKDARCVTAYPEKALKQSEESGVLTVDENKCKGCDWCIQACPHGGLTLHPDKTLVIACDLCGGEPKCIDSCPEKALELVSDDKEFENKWEIAIQKLPHEIERLAEIVKKREWSYLLAEAKERAVKTSEKLEKISKREHSNRKTLQ
jgi:Fe-S-cluster-containing hydrogenase component 2